MRQPRRRVGREVDVVVAEQRVVALHFVDLHQRALGQASTFSGKWVSARVSASASQEGIRRRRAAQVDEDIVQRVQRGRAVAALHAAHASQPGAAQPRRAATAGSPAAASGWRSAGRRGARRRPVPARVRALCWYSSCTSSLSAWKPCATPGGISSADRLVLGQLQRIPAAEGGRAAAQVGGDVEDPAAQAAHQLVFLRRRALQVQPAHACRAGG